MKNPLKWPPIGGKKKSHLKCPLWKEIQFNWLPLGVKKESHLKWPTIGNEKKVIRVTPLEVKKIHLSDIVVVKKHFT
jgi:hypothetical protein